MRQRMFVTAMVLTALVGALLIGATVDPAEAHQQGTPPATSPSITTEVLVAAEPTQASGQALYLLRVTFAPGSAVTAHVHPGATISVGEDVTLVAGDTVYYDGTAVQIERNAGDVPAVVLISNPRDVDEPARQFVEGTPTGS